MATPPTAATQQDIQNSEKLLDLSNQLNNLITERKKLLKGITAEEQLYFSTVKQQQKLSQEVTANAEKYLGYKIKSKDLTKQIKATEDNIAKSRNAYAAIEQKILTSKNKAVLEARKLNSQERTLRGQLLRLEEDSNDLQVRKQEALLNGNTSLARQLQLDINANNRSANILDKRIASTKKSIQQQVDIINNAKKIAKDAQEAAKAQKEELAFLERNLQIRKQIEKSTGLLGAMAKAASKIPGIGQYLNADEAIDEMEKLAAKIEESGEKATSFGNRMKIAGKGLQVLAKGAYENLKSPEAVFTFFFKAALNANDQAVKLGKSLGYAGGRANAFRENLAGIERASNNINVTTANLVEAFSQLTEVTGFAYEFTADQLETQIKLTKQVGLTAEEAAQVLRFGELNGETSEETYKSFVRGLAVTRNQLRVGINFKTALAESVKVSGQLAANLQNSPETIAKAVVTAKAFGMTLEQTAKSGEALLNFESSIENELKAELLTGKELNLERARAAALAGDQITLAEELNKNIGSSADFTKMNVLQQRALAESVGMTADELANTLRRREEAIASGKSLAQITEEEAAQAIERQNIQDKFNAGILKLQSLIGNILAGPLGGFLDMLTGALNIVNSIGNALSFLATPLQVIAGLWLTIKTVQLTLLGIQKVSAAYEAAKAGYAVAQRGAALGYNGLLLARQAILRGELAKSIGIAVAQISGASAATLGIAAGIALAAGAAAYAFFGSKKGDDVLSEGSSGSGYGDRVLFGPEGAISLNNKDTVVAGTDLFKGNDVVSPPKESLAINSPAINFNPMIEAINKLIASNAALATRPINVETNVNLDGAQVGVGMTKASYKVA